MAARCVLAVGAAVLLAGTSTGLDAQDTGWTPEGNVEFIVGAGAGGENDRIARAIQQALQEEGLVPSMTVVNRPGAGQTLAMTQLAGHRGDPHKIGLISGTFITSVALAGSTLHQELMPLVKLFDAYQLYYVRADSDIDTLVDIQERLQADPQSVTFAFPVGLGSPLHISAVNLAATADVRPTDVNTVVFESGAELAAQVAGGHVDVGISSIGSALPLVEAGENRFVAIAAPERQWGVLADVPTAREQGVDLVTANPYTVILPQDLSDEQVAFWQGALEQVLENDGFKADLERNFWVAGPIFAPDAAVFVQETYDEMRTVLEEIGFAE